MAPHDLGSALETTYTAESASGAVSATASAGRQVALVLTPEAMRMHADDLAREILRVQSEAQAAAREALRDAIGADNASTATTPVALVADADEEPSRPVSWLSNEW